MLKKYKVREFVELDANELNFSLLLGNTDE